MENSNTNNKTENIDIEKKKELYIKRLNAVYKIQRVYLIITSIFVSTIIVFGVIMFYKTKSTYSMLLSAIGAVYVTRNIMNFRKLQKPDEARIEEQINRELNNTKTVDIKSEDNK